MGVKYVADGKVVIDVILDDGRVVKGVADINKSFGKMGGVAKKASVSVGSVFKALGLVALAKKGIDMVTGALDGAISRYDTLNNFPRVMQQIGFSAGDSEKAINRLSDGIQGLPTTLDDVAGTAQRIAVLTGDLDGAVETTLALNNAFISSGSSQQDAARGLEQYVQMLSKGEVDLQSWRTLQETMGVALNDTAKAFGFTGASAQNDLYDALKDGHITFDEFNAKIIELSNEQDGFADRALTASGGIRTAYTNMKTAVVRGVTSIIESIDSVLSQTPLKSIENILNGIGKAFNNVLTFIADGIPIVANFIGNLITKFQELTGSTDGIKTSVMNVISTLTDFFAPAFEAVFSFVSSIWTQFVEFFQTHGEMIGQAVHNVMTFIWEIMQFLWPAIEFLIIDTWESIKGVIQGTLDVILGIIQFFGALFTGNWSEMWEATKQIFSGALQLVWNLINLWFIGKILKAGKTFVKGFSNIFKALWNGIKSLFSTSINAVKNIVQAGFNFIRSIISGIMNAIRSFISSIWSGIKGIFSGSVSGLKSIVSNGFRTMVNAIKSLMDSALSAVKNIFKNMIDAGKNAGKMFVGIGKDLIKGLIKGIKNMGKAAIDAITGVVGGVIDKAKSLLKIKSPSRVMMKIGNYTSQGMAKGITKGGKGVTKASKKLADEAMKNLQVRFDTKKLSATSYINALKKVRKNYKLTGDQNRKLQREIYKANQAIKKQAQTHRNTLRKINDGVKSADAQYLKKVRSINNKLAKDIKKVQDDYKKRLADLTQSIYNQNRLFDEVKTEKVDGKQLLKNLQDQNKQFKQFNKDIAKLQKAGVSKKFITELREMGVSAADEIHAIANLPKKELNAYVKAWKEKHKLAEAEAKKQMAKEKANMQKEIRALTKAANKELAQANREWKAKLRKLSRETAKLGSFKNSGKVLGKDTARGLISGLRSMNGPLKKQARATAKTVEREIKKALKIKSPSRLMRDEVGAMIPAGIAEGIDDGTKSAVNAMNRLSDSLSSDIDANVNLIGDLKGFTANKAIGSFVPVTQHIMREVVTEKKGSKVQPVKQQPAYITLVLGGREYSAFVRDISETQARTQLTLEAFRG